MELERDDLPQMGLDQLLWSVPECDCCLLTCLKNRTEVENTAGLNSKGLNTAYVKDLF